MQPNIGVVGAGTLLAKELLIWIEKWHFPYQELHLFDQMQFVGTIKKCKDVYYPIADIQGVAKKNIQILFVCDEMLYKQYRHEIAKDCYCIILRGSLDEHVVLARFNLEDYTETSRCMVIPCSTSIKCFKATLYITICERHIDASG